MVKNIADVKNYLADVHQAQEALKSKLNDYCIEIDVPISELPVHIEQRRDEFKDPSLFELVMMLSCHFAGYVVVDALSEQLDCLQNLRDVRERQRGEQDEQGDVDGAD